MYPKKRIFFHLLWFLWNIAMGGSLTSVIQNWFDFGAGVYISISFPIIIREEFWNFNHFSEKFWLLICVTRRFFLNRCFWEVPLHLWAIGWTQLEQVFSSFFRASGKQNFFSGSSKIWVELEHDIFRSIPIWNIGGHFSVGPLLTKELFIIQILQS